MKRFPLARKLLFRLRPSAAPPEGAAPAGRFTQEALDELVAAAEACDLERLARLRARLHGPARRQGSNPPGDAPGARG